MALFLYCLLISFSNIESQYFLKNSWSYFK
uniref:Uncharacterized protein n=1 Tax=Arundo donax TaxID=35708 RepID=A0A0A9CCN3_ARUDO